MGVLTKQEQALEVVRQVLGKPCWSAIASERTDWVIALDLGEKVRRSMRLANPRLSFLQRTYEGEYSFLIESCWRLDGPEMVICTCYDSNKPGGAMLTGIAELEGRTVEAVDVSSPGCDLTIAFNEGIVLRCLSTESDPKTKRNNWSFWSPSGLVTVGPRGRVNRETQAEAEKRFRALQRSLAQEEDDLEDRFSRKPKDEDDA
jgi:hypothetical protein